MQGLSASLILNILRQRTTLAAAGESGKDGEDVLCRAGLVAHVSCSVAFPAIQFSSSGWIMVRPLRRLSDRWHFSGFVQDKPPGSAPPVSSMPSRVVNIPCPVPGRYI
ncbi:hypothetical protein BO94DRAFT_161023 [Aspergillus sclerotioniger CBS 115572]|uniref:Uncharacterized protein n=1 Tax=Aspergillus sclerotioniger CBS 115572 TaxID=1450535 RepID=A0A317W519_9EURO|nr:hypothetical protein BO94DRAFT_161023 [Aspergillus sclerotioniger CBS 115572]PWY80412.1 hypothetical protein BO94DRAFT_161023 [Aspergillus sclerotioniger CBS 115572]